MKLPNLSNMKGLAQIGKTFVAARRPEILFGASITATVGAVVLAARGGYQARGIIDEHILKQEIDTSSLTPQQKMNLTWHCYTPAAITTLGALGSTTGLHLVHVKEKKAIATTALAALEEVKTQAKQYAEDLAESIQENVELTDEQKAAVQNSLNEKNADRNGGAALVQNTDGEVEELYLVRDPITGRDIWSSKVRIEEAIVEMGNIINASDCASLNNFYEQAGWGRVDQGENLGWSGVLPEIKWHDDFGRPIAGVRDDGRPWRGFRFLPEPEKGFDDNHR